MTYAFLFFFRRQQDCVKGHLWRALAATLPLHYCGQTDDQPLLEMPENNTRIFPSANLSKKEKTELLMEQHRHPSDADAERKHYNDLVAQSKETVGQLVN